MKEYDDLTAEELIAHNHYVCLLFYVDWSPGCKNMIECCDKLQINFSNIRFGRVNVEDCPEMNMEFRIKTIPTMIFIRDGKVIETSDRLMHKDQIYNKLVSLRGKK